MFQQIYEKVSETKRKVKIGALLTKKDRDWIIN